MTETVKMIEQVTTQCDAPDCDVAVAGRDLGIGAQWLRVSIQGKTWSFHSFMCLYLWVISNPMNLNTDHFLFELYTRRAKQRFGE